MVSKLCKIDIDYFGYTFTSGPNKNVSKILYPLETDKNE